MTAYYTFALKVLSTYIPDVLPIIAQYALDNGRWRVGQLLDAQDTVNKWYVGRVIDLNPKMNTVLIHYEGWYVPVIIIIALI